MEFPQSFSGFLEGDFKDTRVWGQGSCCLTFAMRYSSKKFLIAKKDSFLQYILWRANPISSKHASTGELWVILMPWWCVGGKEEVGSNSGANRPYISTHMFSACTFGCWDGGSTVLFTDHLHYVDCSQDHEEQGPGGIEESTECVGEDMRKIVNKIIQHRKLTALQGLGEDLRAPVVLWANFWDVVSTNHVSQGIDISSKSTLPHGTARQFSSFLSQSSAWNV